MNKIDLVEQTQVHDNVTPFNVGDTVNIHYRVREGEKERIQQYEGVVINMRGSGANKTFTVRKISNNVGVERVFPFYTPFISKLEIKKHGKVRRAKLFYLRELRGKAARIKDK
jgi:large subunit ribosomal protein L19